MPSLIDFVDIVYFAILAPVMRSISHLTFIYYSIGTEVSANQLLKRLIFFRKNMYIFELYLQTEERNAKKYNASIRLFENFIGCILLYGLMFTLFSQKTHTHANYIFGLQVYISYLCKNVFHMA